MMDLNQVLTEIDERLTTMLLGKDELELQADILELLSNAAKNPGRAAKLHTTYILERLAELVTDLKEDNAHVRLHEEGFLRWIDRGLTYTAYLTDPDSQGRWLESFDQTLIRANVPDPKDPEEVKQRREEAAELQQKWQEAMTKMPKQKPGGLRSEASEPRRPGGDNLIVLPR
jgi:hypothetical protein